MVEYVCANCGTHFSDYATNRTKGTEHCCSRKCKGEYQTKKAIARVPIKSESRCVACDQVKPITEFYHDKRSRANGYVQYTCKECIKVQRAGYYDQHIEAVNQRVRAYKRQHPGRNGKVTPHRRANRLLNFAVHNGSLVKAQNCQRCGKVGRLHGHHWHGYDNALDVIWLCPSCHHAAHGRGPKVRTLSTQTEGATQ